MNFTVDPWLWKLQQTADWIWPVPSSKLLRGCLWTYNLRLNPPWNIALSQSQKVFKLRLLHKTKRRGLLEKKMDMLRKFKNKFMPKNGPNWQPNQSISKGVEPNVSLTGSFDTILLFKLKIKDSFANLDTQDAYKDPLRSMPKTNMHRPKSK